MGEATRRGSRKDRFLEKLFAFLTRSLYREVDVYSPVPLPSGEPQLNVANHFGGVSDALLLLGVLPDRPGIVARDVIWKVPFVGRLMNWVGAIPVHKPEDHNSSTSNDEMFASCYDALGDNGNILIFPEGVTRNEPSIAPVKTGAARIAIGARAQGVAGIKIIPLGIHYEDKAALRSRVFINVGITARPRRDGGGTGACRRSGHGVEPGRRRRPDRQYRRRAPAGRAGLRGLEPSGTIGEGRGNRASQPTR